MFLVGNGQVCGVERGMGKSRKAEGLGPHRGRVPERAGIGKHSMRHSLFYMLSRKDGHPGANGPPSKNTRPHTSLPCHPRDYP